MRDGGSVDKTNLIYTVTSLTTLALPCLPLSRLASSPAELTRYLLRIHIQANLAAENRNKVSHRYTAGHIADILLHFSQPHSPMSNADRQEIPHLKKLFHIIFGVEVDHLKTEDREVEIANGADDRLKVR